METDPLRVLQRVNRRLRQDLEPGRFVTAFLGFVTPDGLMRWCSAGQAPIIFHSAQNTQSIDAQMPPLGVDELTGESQTTQLPPGGMLVMTSDGISECFNAKGDLLGSQMIVDAIRGVPQPSPQSVLDAMRQLAINWQGKEEPADDQTVIVVQRL
jgi:sigma-B regulation protein RsbU (phosphoserine phosphatase)